jgi:hypothetical protein
MKVEMLIILLLLAGLPLLGLESLRWSRQQDNQRAGRKAVLLIGSSSVLWALLGDYLGVLYPGWGWAISLVLLCVGLALTNHCARNCFRATEGKRPVLRTLLIYAAVFILVTWLIPDWLWEKLRDHIGATGSVSRWRGPLH